VIPLAWVEAANQRWQERMDRVEAEDEALPPLECLGLDVAMGGKDKTVLARRHGVHVRPLERFNFEDTMETAGLLVGILQVHPEVQAWIDLIGVGAGVFHRTREQCPDQALGFNAALHTDERDRSGELGFANARSHAWWHLRELLDPTFGAVIELPPDDELTGDLTAPKFRHVSDGKIQVESKEQLRKAERLGRSTDAGDAVVQACYERAAGMEYLNLGAPTTPMKRENDISTNPLIAQIKDILPFAFDQHEKLGTCGNCIEWNQKAGRCDLRWVPVYATESACALYAPKADESLPP
jgi:hypothetical protein